MALKKKTKKEIQPVLEKYVPIHSWALTNLSEHLKRDQKS